MLLQQPDLFYKQSKLCDVLKKILLFENENLEMDAG